MLNSVAHGGPDDEGIYLEDGVALGHRRLSIIDLSQAGHQPMISPLKDIVISFNGEIYNYLDLRKELEAEGLIFQTATDTEVIIQAYHKWGTQCFDKLQGIFAFALLDKTKDIFFLVRDHLGVKPLYYSFDENELIFSSEVRAFRACKTDWEEDEDWRILFLAFGSIPHPYTTLKNVFQLAPGSYLVIKLETFTKEIKSYFSINPKNPLVKDIHGALDIVKSSIAEALRKNLISDAPLGVFLSGGIDSSLLTLLTDRVQKNIKSISVNFKDASFNEYPYQKIVIDKTRNVQPINHEVSEEMFWEQLEDIWNAMDQPTNDGINLYFITRCAREDGLKVVLSGLGADEIFGGYASFSRMKWLNVFHRLPFKHLIANVMGSIKKSWGRLVYLKIPGPIGDYLFLRGIYTPSEIADILKLKTESVWAVLKNVPLDNLVKADGADYASQLETRIYMTNQLLKDTDVMGMWHAVEVRVPFLDIELFRKVQSIPPSLRFNKRQPKYLIKSSYKDILPDEIVFREKKGFTFPFALWMKRSPGRFIDLLPKSSYAARIWTDFENGQCHWSKCWSLAVLQQFR